MFSTVVGLVIVLAIVRFYLLPLARTAFALDLMVSGYFIIILLSQWVAIWLYPRDEVSCGTGCLIVISGVLFASTRLLFLASVAMASSWIFFKYLAGSPPSINDEIHLLIIAPVCALVVRLVVLRSFADIQRGRERERADATELRKLLSELKRETELRQKSEIELFRAQKNECLGRMAAGIAHDFNNTLTAISAFSHLIEQSEQLDMAHEHSLHIQSAVKKASAICKQMLVYSGRSVSDMQSNDLVETVRELLPLLEVATGVGTEIRYQADVEQAPIHANRSQVEQSLVNLVTNALDSLQGAGEVTIRIFTTSGKEAARQTASHWFACPLNSAEYSAIQVIDNGKGMPEETVRKMFDPYFTTKRTGHGIGLSMVMGIAMQHQAAIQVDSCPGKGTSVTIYFPKSKASTHGQNLSSIGQTSVVSHSP